MITPVPAVSLGLAPVGDDRQRVDVRAGLPTQSDDVFALFQAKGLLLLASVAAVPTQAFFLAVRGLVEQLDAVDPTTMSYLDPDDTGPSGEFLLIRELGAAFAPGRTALSSVRLRPGPTMGPEDRSGLSTRG